MIEEGAERIQGIYRDNYDRQVEIKTRYDPTEPECSTTGN
ncbi:MAG TPA: BBE domain-containing protein [Blastocatellia bacterium]|nr:BBE domain-containing protein [Blastocatellia bacterium]